MMLRSVQKECDLPGPGSSCQGSLGPSRRHLSLITGYRISAMNLLQALRLLEMFLYNVAVPASCQTELPILPE